MTAVEPLFRFAHASGLHAVERELAGMHQEMLRQTGEDARSVRLSVLTLVAACTDAESAEIAGRTVSLIAAQHPARAIIVVADRSGPDRIDADLALQCSVTGEGQICAEVVRIAVSGEPALHLASVVTPLLVADVPVFLWLVGAPPLEQAFAPDVVAICERLLIDTGAYADAAGTLHHVAAELDRNDGVLPLADLAWARTRPWREVIAGAFDGLDTRALTGSVESVEIECSGDAVSAQAWLVAGWLASCLDWQAAAPPRVSARSRQVDGVAPGNLIGVVIQSRNRDRAALIRVRREASTIHACIEIENGSTVCNTVPLPEIDTAQLVGALIEVDDDDPVYAAALRQAARLSSPATP